MSKKLLFSITKKDLQIDFFSGRGAGGQKRNKTQNCVRLHHPDSGVIATGQSNKERKANLQEAFRGLVKHPKFKIWHARKVEEFLTGKKVEDIVKEQMQLENLTIEIKKNGKWQELEPCPPPEAICTE